MNSPRIQRFHKDINDLQSPLDGGERERNTSAQIELNRQDHTNHGGLHCVELLSFQADLYQNASFVLRNIEDVVIEDRPKPELRDPYDVMVHVAQTGICGSDVSCPATIPLYIPIGLI